MTKIRRAEGGYTVFWCPGCDEAHAIQIGLWSWNGSEETPTFQPSILVQNGHYLSDRSSEECWCTFDERHPNDEPSGFSCGVCHSFVTEGFIRFLDDSTHDLAGEIVELPDWEDGF